MCKSNVVPCRFLVCFVTAVQWSSSSLDHPRGRYKDYQITLKIVVWTHCIQYGLVFIRYRSSHWVVLEGKLYCISAGMCYVCLSNSLSHMMYALSRLVHVVFNIIVGNFKWAYLCAYLNKVMISCSWCVFQFNLCTYYY